jgi:hypothetical protein
MSSRAHTLAAMERRVRRLGRPFGVSLLVAQKRNPKIEAHGGYMLRDDETFEIVFGNKGYEFSARRSRRSRPSSTNPATPCTPSAGRKLPAPGRSACRRWRRRAQCRYRSRREVLCQRVSDWLHVDQSRDLSPDALQV